MGISNNAPTMSYIHISGTSVVWNNETYMVQDFATNKRYIYWNSDTPHQLNASNVIPNRSTKQYLVIVNDNGMHSLVPSISDDFSISFEGNSNQAIKNRIFGLYEKNEEFGDKFVAIEQDIDGIRSIVGETEETADGTLINRISKVEQRADRIDLSVEEVSKKYNDDKETNKLREDLNSSIIKLNSTLGTFKSELTDYFKDNEISSEEQIKIKAQLGILTSDKVTFEGYIDIVKLIAESNNQTQDVVAIESAKKALQIAHDNLHNNVTNAVIDSIITPTENTIIIDSFAKYNLRVNELKNTCDDIIILGVGGVITEELANISIKSNEIKLSVSKVESDFKNNMSLQKLELEGQIRDVNSALGTFEETVNTTFKDGIIDEAEKSLLQEKINLIDKEKVDIDLRYNSVIQDLNLSKEVKTELTSKYNEYCNNHNKLKERINSVISDNIINDAEKLEINTLFKTYSNALAYFSALMNKAIESISFNSSKAELEQAKNELNNSINGVKDSIEGIDKVLDGTFEDNILDEVERENIKQSLQNLSKEKLDIDKIYTNLYNNAYLLGQDKVNLKNSYDNYISKYNNVVKVSNDILEKEDLVNNVDKANMDSAIANHNEALALFHVQANKSIDVISANRVNGIKSEINEDFDNLKEDINGLNNYIDESFKDMVLSDAEKSSIKQHLLTLETNKLSVDKQYDVVYNNSSLVDTTKTELKSAYDNYVLKYNSLVNVINNTLSKDDLLVESDSEAINNAFKEHDTAMSIYSEKINKAIDSIALKNIEDAKNKLSIDIRELGDSLGNLENTMNGAFQDGILSESEKKSINQHLLTVSSKKTDIDKRYATLYSNEHLEGTAKTNLTTAYNNYIRAYNSLVTVINNILEKVGLVDSTDKNNLNNAFQEHNSKLGLYSTADLNALDYIAKKKAEVESSKIDEKYADIILDPETGILSKVEHINQEINGSGGLVDRVSSAEQKITDSAIVSTVTSSQTYKNGLNGKVSTNQVISSINQTAEAIKISANKLDLTGELDLQGRFKCWKSNTDKTGNYLHMDGAMMFGYNKTGGNKPVFASGLWTDENMGYFSVGYTRADISDENGCLWMSPQHGNNGCRLTFSILKNSVRKTTNLFFQKDGSLMFYTDINGLNGTDDRYTYQFDSGVSTRSLRCDNLRTYNIYPRSTGSYNLGSHSMRFKDAFVDSVSTTNNQLRLGTVTSTGTWQTYGALDINSSTGYVFPHKGNGQLSLGTSSNRFHTLYSVNAVNVSSDRRAKTDIHYLEEPYKPMVIDNRVDTNMNITTQDMYDFVKDDLKLASYRYNVNLDRGITATDYGFIAQDILYTKVGSEIVQLADKNDLDSELSYNQGNYINVLAGALQEAIKKIEILENKIKELES